MARTKGISIGIGDAVADVETMGKIKNVIAGQKNEVEKIVLCYKTRKMEPEPGLNQVETFEKSINQINCFDQAKSQNCRDLIFFLSALDCKYSFNRC